MAKQGWSLEQCPHCLFELALQESSDAEFEHDDGGTAVTQNLVSSTLSPGKILGNRYGVRRQLGRGGMGEVWRAFDLKLRVDVALKAVRADLLENERILETLRQEVRAAREVASPNVCRIYDLEELDHRELVSMEYVAGDTLREVLRSRGPLDLQEAREIASQLLAGLEAIHAAGLVHRDLKPENVMITPASRVVVMDFGIAKGLAEAVTGTVAGTPAYMAPEQSRGEPVDARADVFSAGVMLAEMLAAEASEERESRQALLRGVRQEPPQLPDSPWKAVLERAVASTREHRFATAAALARALEDVTLRVEGAEDVRPFPGLVAFTEKDRDYFFGRELEVERIWKTLRRMHMLALIGPSGAGKTSFLRAGLLANKPSGWAHVICTPGEAPVTAVREALVPAISDDSKAMRELVRVEDPEAMVSAVSRWRKRSKHALLVVDQFEELFTLNPPEVQTDFAELLGRLAIDADVRVLLSIRDDFLVYCHSHEPLRPILSELTVLGAPTGAALRRAVVQPALKCGYRFEDEALVDGMMAEVEGERGALPLLAFAAAELWERRDKDQGLLTRDAYEVIGGVGGALAQHAELTLEHIGADQTPTVRELFRNLVTSQGTRAVRERDELLSVFAAGERDAAAEVLDALVDARLLTTYSVEGTENGEGGGQRTEIVHESLLTAWPRLVRWMAQDVEGARLRDDLRQAARRWQERDRPDDLLWTGSAFREYQLWRERYPGHLSEIEGAFAAAMEALAARRRQRRRLTFTGVLAAAIVVAAVTTGLWRQSVLQTRRAEASELFALGRSVLETDRSEALAFAIASLEKADSQQGRRLALRALWAGPPAIVLPDPPPGSPRVAIMPELEGSSGLAFSPDGSTIAAGYPAGVLRVFRRDGSPPLTVQGFEEDQGAIWNLSFSHDGRHLVGGALKSAGEVRVWETQGWQLVRTLRSPEAPGALPEDPEMSIAYGFVEPDLSSVLTVTFVPASGEELEVNVAAGAAAQYGFVNGRWLLRRWPLAGDGASPERRLQGQGWPMGIAFSPDGSSLALAVVGRHDAEFSWFGLAFDPIGDRLASCDLGRTLRMWPLAGDGTSPERRLQGQGWPMGIAFSPDGSSLALAAKKSGGRLWDLRGPAFAEPLRLGVDATFMWQLAFSGGGRWLVTTGDRLTLWPMSNRYPRVLRSAEAARNIVRLHPGGTRLFTVARNSGGVDLIHSWPLTGGAGLGPTVVFRGRDLWTYNVDPQGRFLVVLAAEVTRIVPLDGAPPTVLEGVQKSGLHLDTAGRYLASRFGGSVVVHDLETGEQLELEPPGDGVVERTDFDPSGRLLLSRGGVVSRWDPETQEIEALIRKGVKYADAFGDGGRLIAVSNDATDAGTRLILDLRTGSRAALPQAHQGSNSLGWDHTGSIVASGHPDGEVRVGRLFDEEPHLLLGHGMGETHVSVSADGKWVFSRGSEGTVRMWPVPDLGQPPFHTLPYEDLMTKLRTFTNLRAVPDDESHTGYTVQADSSAYRGWAEVPTW
jgi:WD40 repeat protein